MGAYWKRVFGKLLAVSWLLYIGAAWERVEERREEGGRDDRGLLSGAHRCKLQPLAGLLRPRPLSSGVAVARSACVR